MKPESIIIGKGGDIVPPPAHGVHTISRHHLSVEPTSASGIYRLVDLGSTNHSYYYDPDNRSWKEFRKLRVSEGARIRLGDYVTSLRDLLPRWAKVSEPMELKLIPADRPGTYRILCADPEALAIMPPGAESWTPLQGNIVTPDTQLRIGVRMTQVGAILQSSSPYRNKLGEICYNYTM